jgi:hypothetical protein
LEEEADVALGGRDTGYSGGKTSEPSVGVVICSEQTSQHGDPEVAPQGLGWILEGLEGREWIETVRDVSDSEDAEDAEELTGRGGDKLEYSVCGLEWFEPG